MCISVNDTNYSIQEIRKRTAKNEEKVKKKKILKIKAEVNKVSKIDKYIWEVWENNAKFNRQACMAMLNNAQVQNIKNSTESITDLRNED